MKQLVPLAEAQKRVWYTESLFPNTGVSNIAVKTKLSVLDPAVLKEAIQLFIAHNEMMRLRLLAQEGAEPVQYISDEITVNLPMVDLSTYHEEELTDWLEEQAQKPFSLYDSPLYDFQAVKGKRENFLFIKCHHMMIDGISIDLVVKKIHEIYQRLLQGESLKIETSYTIEQHLESEEAYMLSSRFQKDQQFWDQEFANLPESMLVQAEKLYMKSLTARRQTFTLSPEFKAQIDQFCKQHKVTPNILFMSALLIYFSRIHNDSEATLGTFFANRNRKERDALGMFVSTVPFWMEVNPKLSVLEWVREVNRKQMRLLRYQKYPYNRLIQDLRQKGKKVKQLFTVGFEYHEILTNFEPICSRNEVNELTIHLKSYPLKDQLDIYIDYRQDIHTAAEVDQLMQRVLRLVQDLIRYESKAVGQLEICTAEENQKLLVEWNDTESDYPKNKTIHQLFEERVAKTPDQIAVVYQDQQLTYQELNERANCVARILRERGIKRDDRVGLFMNRSLELIVGLLGILKSGGAYVPIDPEYPTGRISYMLEDSNVKFVLSQMDIMKQFHAEIELNLTWLDIQSIEQQKVNMTNLSIINQPTDLAYVIYTSGTTGRPKGVMVEHQGVVNLASDCRKRFQICQTDRVGLFANLAFDASVWEIGMGLFSGASLYLLSKEIISNPPSFEDYVNEQKLSLLTLPPTFLQYLHRHRMDGLRKVIVAGSASSRELVEQWQDIYLNAYGPTEVTVCATTWEPSQKEEIHTVLIGKPIANKKVYVVNDMMQLQPIGVPGELCIGGVGLARGYLNQPELTAEKFIPNPFAPGERMYRTGDLARWLPDGNIEFLGRIDQQVKVRGFRIELGEIESVLMEHPQVKNATVRDWQNDQGETYLCAYVVLDGAITIAELKTDLIQKLPNYMIPAFLLELEELPLTANGKVDRGAVPRPEGEQLQKEYVAPSTELEIQLAQIWQNVLEIERVGVTDHFFELGGHSLKAIQLMSFVHQQLQIELPVRTIFEYPTIQGLAMYVQEQERVAFQGIQPASAQPYYPVSSAQKRTYVLQQMEPDATHYNVPKAMLLEGELDPSRLEEVLQQLIQRHEALRTSFEVIDGEPVQRIHDQVDWKLSVQKGTESEAKAWIRPLSLAQAPLFRAELIQLTHDKHLLLIDLHHIIADGVSMDLLWQDLSMMYRGDSLPELRIQYKDFAVWEQEWLESGNLQQQEQYWLEQFADELPVLELPTDQPRPEVQSFAGKHLSFALDQELTTSLKQLASETGTTLYMLLLTAYNVLLHKYTGQTDLIVGSPVVGRTHADVQKLMGMFVNTLAMRNRPEGHKKWVEFIEEVKTAALEGYDHADYPFEMLVEKLPLDRDTSRNPLLQTMFSMQDVGTEILQLDQLAVKPYELDYAISKFDLTLFTEEKQDRIVCQFEYATALFEPSTIERMSHHFVQIVQAMVSQPQQCIADVDMLTEAEKRQLVVEWNDTKIDYPKNKTIHELFEEQVAKAPNKIAVVFQDEELTYQELNERANCVAHSLCEQGVSPDDRVGLLMDRSIEMIIGILGILKSGGAYVPIDPEYPTERVSYMLADSNVKCVLSQMKIIKQFAIEITLDLTWMDIQTIELNNGEDLPKINQPTDLAYVMYTSGTTGRPKGVMIEHHSIINLTRHFQQVFQIGVQDRVGQFTSISFDVSMHEIFSSLLTGATLQLISQEKIYDYRVFEQFVAEQEITLLALTPTYLKHLQPERMGSVRKIFTGGAASSLELVKKWGSLYVNAYGPTETTVYATTWEPNPKEATNCVQIGKPMANKRAYIMNQDLQLQPIGILGELCIGGVGLARGYLNKPELTEEKFVPNPFVPSERIYRTGDLARYLPNGQIEFLGRIDQQVKVRGFRIEPGEIESALLKHAQVKDTTVKDWQDEQGEAYLCAYVVLDGSISVTELKNHLSQMLPNYMVPAFVLELDEIPLTTNGKVDRNALPQPNGAQLQKEYVAPSTALEIRLAEIWQDVLGVERVGVTDHFFELGGDSIKAIQVVAKLKNIHFDLKVSDLLHSPTIEKVTPYIEERKQQISQEQVEGQAPLMPIQHEFFENEDEYVHHYNQAMMLMSSTRIQEDVVRAVCTKLIEHHDALRMVYRKQNGKWIQINQAMKDGLFRLTTFDLRHQHDVQVQMKTLAQQQQSQFDITTGPLMNVAIFQTDQRDYLLFVIHHLVVDGVSWRILLEDFIDGYQHVLQQKPIEFQKKSHSYLDWAQGLQAYADHNKLKKESDYWKKICQTELVPLPRDREVTKNLMQDSDEVKIALTNTQTRQLLSEIHHAYNTEINDILLIALGMTIREWTSHDRVGLMLEGHGREEILDQLQMHRTVGWFTSCFPVILDLQAQASSEDATISQQMKQVKETLRRVPERGIGYGILKYVNQTADLPACEPEIVFNYLGQFDSSVLGEEQFRFASLDTGNAVHPRMKRTYRLGMNGFVMNDQFCLRIDYSRLEYDRETIQTFATQFQANLERIIQHCLQKSETETTPSDLGDSDLSFEELEQLQSIFEG